MTTPRELAEKVLATCRLQRCSRGYNDNTGEYEAGSCEEDATHRITSPHEDRRWDYCAACAKEIHASIEHNHRWSLWTIPGLEGVTAAQALARAVIEASVVLDRVAYDMVSHNLIHHPLPWRVERDWTHEVTAADGTIITKCQTHEHAAAVITLAEQIRAFLDEPTPEDAEVP